MLPFINYPFVALSKVIGAGPDELKLIFSFLLSYPAAGLLKRLPDASRTQKNLFVIGVSLFYLCGLFSLWGGIRTLFISSAGAYAISKYIRGPYMPWVGFVFVMGHMLYSHYYRDMRPVDGAVDITGAQMVLVMKLTAFCWNVHDGQLPESELTDHQKNRALKKLPSLLDFASYVLFFPSLFAGPAFDYAEYDRWLDTSMFDVDVPASGGKAAKRRRKIPSSKKPATIKAIQGLIWIGAFVKLSTIYNEDFAIGEGYKQYSFLRKVWWLYMFAFTARTKYYGVWLLTEGACILTGIGYNGIDEKTKQPRWDRVTNVDAYELEMSQNVRAYLEAWNKNTNKWLKNYVYLRVTPKGKKPGFRSSLATFTTSALWHGVAPGYYLTFITAAFCQTIGKYFRRNVRPFFMTPDQSGPGPYKHIYDIVCWIMTQFGFSYVTVPFLVLFMNPSIIIWARVKFFGHILIILFMAFFNSPAKAVLAKKLKARAGRATMHRSKSQDEIHEPTLGLNENALEELEEEILLQRQEFKKRRDSLSFKHGKTL